MRAVFQIFSPEKHLAAVCGLFLLLLAPCKTTGAQTQNEPPARPEAGARQQGRAVNLMQRLGLTQEQREQLRQIRTQSEAEARELTRRMRLARRALDEAIYADSIDDALIEQRSRELASAQTALMRLRAATELKVRRVLTAEQLRLFRNLRRQAQRRQMLQRRMNRATRPSEAPSPDASAPADTQPAPPSTNPPPARRRRP